MFRDPVGINVQTVLTVQTCLEECGPGNKDETGHWPLPDLGEKPHRGWGCMSGYVCVWVILKEGALVLEEYYIVSSRGKCHVVTHTYRHFNLLLDEWSPSDCAHSGERRMQGLNLFPAGQGTGESLQGSLA